MPKIHLTYLNLYQNCIGSNASKHLILIRPKMVHDGHKYLWLKTYISPAYKNPIFPFYVLTASAYQGPSYLTPPLQKKGAHVKQALGYMWSLLTLTLPRCSFVDFSPCCKQINLKQAPWFTRSTSPSRYLVLFGKYCLPITTLTSLPRSFANWFYYISL